MAPLPAAAQAISGKTYVFAANPSGIESLAVDFDGSDTATMRIKLAGSELQTWPLGLDGVYCISAGRYGLQGLRGAWEDATTFVCEYDNIGNNDHVFLRLRFAGASVEVETHETAHEGSARFEGKSQ